MLPVAVLDPRYGAQVTIEMQNIDSDLPLDSSLVLLFQIPSSVLIPSSDHGISSKGYFLPGSLAGGQFGMEKIMSFPLCKKTDIIAAHALCDFLSNSFVVRKR